MKRAAAAGAAAILAAAALLVPLPLVVISPGAALSVPERVELGRDPDPVSGQLLLTTVALSQPTAAGALEAWIDGDDEVFRQRDVIPPGIDPEEYTETQRQLFRESSRVAAAVGLRAAGLEVGVSGEGAQVSGVLPGSPAEGRLRPRDVVTALDDRAIALASDLVAAVSRRAAGDEVTLTVRRGERDLRITVTLAQLGELGRPGLGVTVGTVGLDFSLPFPVEVRQGSIGGPSAGLMTALTVYDLADPGDLTRGRAVAGTGTIDLDGRVGPVGGVRQKVDAAEAAAASVFLVPAEELDQARDAAGDDLEVVGVATLDDAIAALARPDR
ncbi:MAG: YlbL family protein [Acidimicrobiales bacterium]